MGGTEEHVFNAEKARAIDEGVDLFGVVAERFEAEHAEDGRVRLAQGFGVVPGAHGAIEEMRGFFAVVKKAVDGPATWEGCEEANEFEEDGDSRRVVIGTGCFECGVVVGPDDQRRECGARTGENQFEVDGGACGDGVGVVCKGVR